MKMISLETEARLIKLVLTIIREEGFLEDHRQRLAKREEFNPYIAFQHISQSNKDYITTKHIKSFLSYFHCNLR